jgi:hypothetical protein
MYERYVRCKVPAGLLVNDPDVLPHVGEMFAAVGAGRLLAQVDLVPVAGQVVVALELLLALQATEVLVP